MISWHEMPAETSKLELLHNRIGAPGFIDQVKRTDLYGELDIAATVAAAGCELIIMRLATSGLRSPGHVLIKVNQDPLQKRLAVGHELAHEFIDQVPPEALAEAGLTNDCSPRPKRVEEFCEFFGHKLAGVELPYQQGQLALFHETRSELYGVKP